MRKRSKTIEAASAAAAAGIVSSSSSTTTNSRMMKEKKSRRVTTSSTSTSTSSPYFDDDNAAGIGRNNRNSRSTRSSSTSQFFVTSPSSTYGSVLSFGTFLSSLVAFAASASSGGGATTRGTTATSSDDEDDDDTSSVVLLEPAAPAEEEDLTRNNNKRPVPPSPPPDEEEAESAPFVQQQQRRGEGGGGGGGRGEREGTGSTFSLSSTTTTPIVSEAAAVASGCFDKSCQQIINAALIHFKCCPIFNELWRVKEEEEKERRRTKEDEDGYDDDVAAAAAKNASERDLRRRTSTCDCECPCLEKAERRLEFCVRHLCRYRCYMRAYAPCRDWHSLRKDVAEAACELEFDLSVEDLLAGWRCVLIPPPLPHGGGSSPAASSLYLPRTAFVDPKDGRLYKKKQVLDRTIVGVDNANFRNGTTVGNKSPTSSRHDPGGGGDDDCCSSGSGGKGEEERLHGGDSIVIRCTHSNSSRYDNSKEEEGNGASRINVIGLAKTVQSPLGLLEELFADDPWALLLSTIFLNRTTRTQVDPVLYEFLNEWPTCDDLLTSFELLDYNSKTSGSGSGNADHDQSLEQKQKRRRLLEDILRPMGLYAKRADGILRFSIEYRNLLDRKVKEAMIKDVVPDGCCRPAATLAAITAVDDKGSTLSEDLIEQTLKRQHEPLQQPQRLNTLKKQVARELTKTDVLSLYQCGEYAYGAYRLFIQRSFDDHDPVDHALSAYAEYQRGICAAATADAVRARRAFRRHERRVGFDHISKKRLSY